MIGCDAKRQVIGPIFDANHLGIDQEKFLDARGAALEKGMVHKIHSRCLASFDTAQAGYLRCNAPIVVVGAQLFYQTGIESEMAEGGANRRGPGCESLSSLKVRCV